MTTSQSRRYAQGPGPIPIEKIGASEDIKRAVKTACGTIYKDVPYSSYIIAYRYGPLFMYSISASSRQEVLPSAIDFDAIKSTFVSSLEGADFQAAEVVLGSIWYTAPSSVKFMVAIHT